MKLSGFLMSTTVWALVFSPVCAHADTFYNYTGPTYATCSGSYVSQCSSLHVTGTLDLTLTLAQLQNLNNSVVFPASFSFSDGSGLTISNLTPYAEEVFIISTDASGNIVDWSFRVDDQGLLNSSPPVGTQNVPYDEIDSFGSGPPEDASHTATCNIVALNNCSLTTIGSGFTNRISAGTWSAPTTSAVPEPGTLLLFGSGLLSIAYRARNVLVRPRSKVQ